MEGFTNQKRLSPRQESKSQSENSLMGIKGLVAALAAGVALNIGPSTDIGKTFNQIETSPAPHEQIQNQINHIENTIEVAAGSIQEFTQNTVRQALNLDKLKTGDSLLEKSENFLMILESVMKLLGSCIPVYKILTAKNTIREIGTKDQGEGRTVAGETFNIVDNVNWLAKNIIDLWTQPQNFYFNLINTIENTADLVTQLGATMKMLSGKGKGEDLDLNDLKNGISSLKENIKDRMGVETLQPKDLLPYMDEFRKKFPGQFEKFMEEIIKNPNSYSPETWKSATQNMVDKFKQVLPESLADKIDVFALAMFAMSLFFGDGMLPLVISTVKDTMYNFKIMMAKNANLKANLPDVITNSLWSMQEFSIYSVYGMLQLVSTALGTSTKGVQEKMGDNYFRDSIMTQINKLVKQNGATNEPTPRPEAPQQNTSSPNIIPGNIRLDLTRNGVIRPGSLRVGN